MYIHLHFLVGLCQMLVNSLEHRFFSLKEHSVRGPTNLLFGRTRKMPLASSSRRCHGADGEGHRCDVGGRRVEDKRRRRPKREWMFF